ncbi:MAG: hypothetical protein COC07_00425 [Erythrobacteraceae bacterium]|nr:MAG: hypothetical protein COC07_00425 [Erythrobacteraceae bacterium]
MPGAEERLDCNAPLGVEALRRLITSGANPNERMPDGSTPLMWASSFGHFDAVSTLLELGANPKLEDEHGRSALTLAIHQGHEQTATALTEQGADLNQSLLHAASRGHAEVMRFLLRHEVEVNWRSEQEQTALILATKRR